MLKGEVWKVNEDSMESFFVFDSREKTIAIYSEIDGGHRLLDRTGRR